MEDEGDFLRGEELRFLWHTALLEGFIEVAVASDPIIEVIQGPFLGLRLGEIHHGQFGFAIAFDCAHKDSVFIRFL